MFRIKVMDYFVSEARSEIFFLQPMSFIFTRCEFYLGVVHLRLFGVGYSIYGKKHEIKFSVVQGKADYSLRMES